FYILLEGEVDFFVLEEKNRTRMKSGDTVYLAANIPHRVALAPGRTYAKALNVYGRDCQK
ncbi:MAG: cupin domain-containing protein, partial [Lentisphaeria bacterium]|nr:cupin domain-containing protein [Lentisphaeria bacterium]